MSMCYVFVSLSFRALAILATSLQGTDDGTIALSTALNRSSLDLVRPSNASIEDLDASSGNGLNIQCDGAKYGFNPSLSDCESARAYIAPDSKQITFGERHTGLPKETFPLPFIIMGDKAECYFQPIIVGDAATGRASLNQIRIAASALLSKCASSDSSQGGIVTNIGGDKNMAVTMGVFDPSKIKCRGLFESRSSCIELFAGMPVTTKWEVFGPPDLPYVDEILPMDVVSEDDKCVLTLYSTGKSDVVAWYQVWKAAEATFARCGRSFQGGSYRGLGEEGNVFFTLGSRRPTVSKGNSSDDATS